MSVSTVKDEWFIETPVVGVLDTECGGNKMNHQTANNGHLLAARMVSFGEYSVDGTASAMKARDWKDATDLVAQPIAFNIAPGKGDLKDDIHVTDAHISKTIDASGSNPAMHQGGAAIVQPIAFHPTQDPISSTDGTTHGLGCGSSSGQASIAVAQPVGVDIFNAAFSGEVAVPLTNRSDGTGTGPTVMQAVGTDCFNGNITGDIACTMGTMGSSVNASGPTVMQSMAVRRLTPMECERLQGFPDGYTNIPWRKASEAPDGPRYKALGNSWAVPVVRWIGKRIQERITT